MEADLQLFRSDDGGLTWIPVDGTLDTDANTLTYSGSTSFSRFTLSAGALGVLAELDAMSGTYYYMFGLMIALAGMVLLGRMEL